MRFPAKSIDFFLAPHNVHFLNPAVENRARAPTAKSAYCVAVLKRLFSVHASLDGFGGDFVLFDDVDDSSPTRGRVAIESVDQGLRDALEQLVGLHLGLPQRLAHTEKLFFASS